MIILKRKKTSIRARKAQDDLRVMVGDLTKTMMSLYAVLSHVYDAYVNVANQMAGVQNSLGANYSIDVEIRDSLKKMKDHYTFFEESAIRGIPIIEKRLKKLEMKKRKVARRKR